MIILHIITIIIMETVPTFEMYTELCSYIPRTLKHVLAVHQHNLNKRV